MLLTITVRLPFSFQLRSCRNFPQDCRVVTNIDPRTDYLPVRLASYTSQRRSTGRATVQTTPKEGRLVYPGYHCSGIGRPQRMATIPQGR